jgi:LPXTG-motif cell wall-anchored protein
MRKKALIFLISMALLLPFFSSAQDNSQKKKAYLFFLTTCPHCQNVDNYFSSNGIYDKYDITKMDASNPFNANLLSKFYDASGESGKGGVPAVAFGDKFIVGDGPIIDNFAREIDAADNANTLPDPNKNVPDSNNTVPQANNVMNNQEKTQPSAQTGNKKNIFPVVIVALVLIGGGALIYINRKKS